MPGTRTGALTAAGIAAVLALGACGSAKKSDSSASTSSGAASTSATTTADKGPIVIGAAVDDTNFMRPIDQPPLAAARLEAARINAAGGVDGRRIEFKVINTQIDPERTRAAATQLLDGGASVLWVTCDVDLSTPSIQVGLAKKVLTVAPCIGTDQMGARRFGDAGKLAFSFGNVAQDEGAAMARAAIDKGWRTSNLISDRALVYTQNVCEAFSIAFARLGGRVLDRETFTTGDNTISGVVSKINKSQADVDTLCTTAGRDLPAFVTGLRGLGNRTPILGPWSIDGTYWLPKSTSAADDIHLVTFASVFADDPDPKVRSLIDEMKRAGQAPTTGGFLTGPETVDAIVQAIRDNGGSTDGTKLAASMEGFRDVRTSLGTISFSPQLHTVFGREYRVIDIMGGKGKLGGTVRADAPVTLGG
ncbi:MAG: transporter substrate-binding protein [Conexibacter sp.]|nr:transporter substrate-binding protein [Conexibacter sp.]